jgi:hypothetical protein
VSETPGEAAAMRPGEYDGVPELAAVAGNVAVGFDAYPDGRTGGRRGRGREAFLLDADDDCLIDRLHGPGR